MGLELSLKGPLVSAKTVPAAVQRMEPAVATPSDSLLPTPAELEAHP